MPDDVIARADLTPADATMIHPSAVVAPDATLLAIAEARPQSGFDVEGIE